MLNFIDETGSGATIMIWSFLLENFILGCKKGQYQTRLNSIIYPQSMHLESYYYKGCIAVMVCVVSDLCLLWYVLCKRVVISYQKNNHCTTYLY